MAPINYQIDVQAPFQAALQGYQAGAAVRDDQLVQQQRLAAQQAQQQMQSDVGALIRNPNASPADFAAMTLKYPALKDQFKQASEMLSTEQKQNFVSHGTQVFAALSNNRPDVAKSLIAARVEAMRNSGNEKGAADTEMIGKMIDINPALARNIVSLKLTGMDDKFAQNVAALGKEDRDAAQGPAELAKKEADAKKAGVEAQYAEPLKVAEIKQAGAQLGLTGAQTNQAIALTRKYGAETQKAILEAATGDPAKRFDAETKLRGEYVTGTKDATATIDAYRKMTASDPNSVGDIALVYGFMKMLDPTSVVREGEFATAQNAAGVPERVMNLYNKALEGKNRLPDGQRAKILAQAKSLAGTAEEKRSKERERLAPVLRTYKLDEKNVYGEAPKDALAPSPADAAPPATATPKPIKSDAEYNALPSGSTFIAPDGSTRRKP